MAPRSRDNSPKFAIDDRGLVHETKGDSPEPTGQTLTQRATTTTRMKADFDNIGGYDDLIRLGHKITDDIDADLFRNYGVDPNNSHRVIECYESIIGMLRDTLALGEVVTLSNENKILNLYGAAYMMQTYVKQSVKSPSVMPPHVFLLALYYVLKYVSCSLPHDCRVTSVGAMNENAATGNLHAVNLFQNELRFKSHEEHLTIRVDQLFHGLETFISRQS